VASTKETLLRIDCRDDLAGFAVVHVGFEDRNAAVISVSVCLMKCDASLEILLLYCRWFRRLRAVSESYGGSRRHVVPAFVGRSQSLRAKRMDDFHEAEHQRISSD